MPPLQRFINCGLTDHFDCPALFSLFIHCFIGVFTSAVKVLGYGAARRCPCCLLLSIRLRLQSKWLYRRAAAKPSIEQYYMLQSDMYWSLSFGLIKCLQYSNTLNRKSMYEFPWPKRVDATDVPCLRIMCLVGKRCEGWCETTLWIVNMGSDCPFMTTFKIFPLCVTWARGTCSCAENMLNVLPLSSMTATGVPPASQRTTMSLPLLLAWRNGLPSRAVMIWDASPEWENRFASIPNRTRDFEITPSAGVCSWTTGRDWDW